MTHRYLKPLALAVGMTLGTAAMASSTSFNVSELDTNINACADFNGFVNAK